jgi:hypothetical protein
MSSVSGVKQKGPGRLVCAAAACMVVAIPAWAQNTADQLTGVSHPSSAPITTDANDLSVSSAPAPAHAKPSAAIPATPTTTYGTYVPYRPASSDSNSTAAAEKPYDPDANIVTESTAGRAARRPLAAQSADKLDEDAGIVTYVPSRPGEIPEGSLVKVRLREQLSTLEGRVTWVRGGKRIGGQAAIHLEPRTVTLPDGTQYVLRARAIDTDSWENTKVDSEGTIMRSENKKRNAAIMSLTTGSGLAAGAMIAGPAGALVGAGVGAGVSTVVWLKQDRQAELPKDLQIIFSLTEPMSVTPASAALTPIKPIQAGGE